MKDDLLSPSRFVIHPEILALPTGHLQLSEGVRLVIEDQKTIGRLITAFERGSPEWTPLVRSKLSSVFYALKRQLQGGKKDGWDRFRRERPRAADSTAIYFTSPSLDSLADSVRTLPLGTLHLRKRARTAFVAANIETVGNLIDAAKVGLVNPRPAGSQTCMQIIEALQALAEVAQSSGSVDWTAYAKRRGICLLPIDSRPSYTALQFLRKFPEEVEAAVHLQFGNRGSILLQRHMLAAGLQRISLNELGSQMRVTRESVRKLKESVLQTLRGAILEAEYEGCRFRFRSEFTEPLRRLTTGLERLQDRAISYPEWEEILSKHWSVAPIELGPLERVLLEIMGFQLVSFKERRFRSMILPANRRAFVFRGAMRKAELMLAREFAAGLSKAQLFKMLRTNPDPGGLKESDIRAVLQCLPGVRRAKADGRYQAGLSDVKTIGNRLERILRQRGTAVHFRELAKIESQARINVPKDSERSVVSALSTDKRFKPVARKGLWALAEWTHVETRTVTDLAAGLLQDRNRPMTETELFRLMSRMRQVAQASIRTRLERDPRFKRVAPQTWELRLGRDPQMVPTRTAG